MEGIEERPGIDIAAALDNARDADRCFDPRPGAWRKQMLTADGWDAAVLLGKRLRRKYGDTLLAGDDAHLKVDARATDTMRTQLSAQAVLEGISPGLGRGKTVYSATTWSLFSGARPFDKLMIALGPFAHKLMRSMKVHGDIREVIAGHSDLRQDEKFLRAALHEIIRTTDKGGALLFDPTTVSIFLLGDSLNQRRMHGGDLPPAVPPPLAHSLENYFEDAFDRCVQERADALEAHGPLLREILATCKFDTSGKTLFLYCAHDLTILSMLRVLCLFPKPYPKTLTSLIFEVYEWFGRLYLRVIYAGRDATIPCVRYEETPTRIAPLDEVEYLIFRAS